MNNKWRQVQDFRVYLNILKYQKCNNFPRLSYVINTFKESFSVELIFDK